MDLATFQKTTQSSLSVPTTEQLTKGQSWQGVTILGGDDTNTSSVMKAAPVLVEEAKPDIPKVIPKAEPKKVIEPPVVEPTPAPVEDDGFEEVKTKQERIEEKRNAVYKQAPKKPVPAKIQPAKPEQKAMPPVPVQPHKPMPPIPGNFGHTPMPPIPGGGFQPTL